MISSDSKIFSGNLTWNISDHYPQFLMIKNIHSDKKIKHNIHQRNWNKFNKNEFILDFLEIDWNITLKLDKGNVDISLQIILDKINNLADKHAPIQKLTRKTSHNLY